MRSHLKVYFSFEEDTHELTDDEKGRLLLAMLRYAETGIGSNLTGNERFLWPVFRAQIDRDIDVYETKVSNGSRGGRPKTEAKNTKPEETENNLTKPEETEDNLNRKIEDKDKDIKRERLLTESKEKKSRFVPPTVEEVAAYCRERGNNIDAETFVNFYQSKGWLIGKSPVKDWKACVRTWERNRNTITATGKAVNAQLYEQRNYEDEQADAMRRMLEGAGFG